MSCHVIGLDVSAWRGGCTHVTRASAQVQFALLFFFPPLLLPLLLLPSSSRQAKIKETFVAFDVDQNGEINMTELRALLGRLGEMPSEKHLQVGCDAVRCSAVDRSGRIEVFGSARLEDMQQVFPCIYLNFRFGWLDMFYQDKLIGAVAAGVEVGQICSAGARR